MDNRNQQRTNQNNQNQSAGQGGQQQHQQHQQQQQTYQHLPSKRSVEQAIKVIEDFRAVCRHQMDFGYWATVDFPSKYHINKLLQLGYRKREELVSFYGEGLLRHALELLPTCKAYVGFLREDSPKSQESK